MPMKSSRRVLVLMLLGVLVISLALATTAGAASKAEIDQAIEDGLAYLVPLQSTGGAPAGAWPGDSFYSANTGFAVAALEHYAEQLRLDPLDPAYAYSANVQAGIDYLISSATYDAANQWVFWNDPSFYNSYQTGPCLMAIARSGAPDKVVTGGALDGFTYKQVAQMVVDWLASAQVTSGTGTGAWYYSKGYLDGDQSATGWATMGLGYAAHSMDCTLPADMLARLSIWNDFIQSDIPGPTFGGAAYTNSYLDWYNVYKTGHLLFAQGLCGDTVATQRVQDALTFMTVHWNDPTNGAGSSGDFGWRGDPANGVLPAYIATAAAMKGFTELGIESFNGIDWYADFTDVIVANQAADGSWLGGGHGESVHRSTAWALLTLLKATSFIPPQVTTSAATAVTGETATLNGSLDDLGSGTSVDLSFEYGTASGVYTDETAAQTATATGAFSADLTGLTRGVTYYFRAKAAGEVVAYGDELSFTTTEVVDPPSTIVRGCPGDWVRKPVLLRFVATPAPGGAPVAYTEYSVAGGKWVRGTSVTIKRQGVTTVRYRSVDTVGTVEATRSCKVRLDSIAPVVVCYGRPLAWQGGMLRFAYKVTDASGSVITRLAITRYHKPIKQYALGSNPTGRRVVNAVRCDLGVGTWSWRVVAFDRAGNRGIASWRYLDVVPARR